jgi:tetratricopeptide (TPR) repeat protein/tRNA A-37 threonylcarbamoyl transferase component Bud32
LTNDAAGAILGPSFQGEKEVPATCPNCRKVNPDGALYCSHCARPLTQTPEQSRVTETLQTGVIKELTTGSTFAGRYQVIEELGKGGMGRVYKVLDEKIKEKVALKLLKPEVSADEQAIERFSNELRLARKISHRHVCRMFDLGEDRGTHFITMEYVPGEDLKSILRMMGQMSPGKAVLVARQVCEGLAEAHRLGVVHRDLKPQNIMIDRDGNVRIMDFGIARSLKVKGMTGAGVVIGTPEYMSPEQIEGQEVDNRSDIYSLGIILYEMVTGRVPFEGETFLSIAVKQKTERPRPPRELNPQIPEDLVRVILRCLEKDKAARYQSVEEVLAELDKIEKGIPTTEKILPAVKPSTSREITVKFRPKRLIIPGAALVALVALAILGFRLLGRKGLVPAPAGKPSLAVMYFENMTGDAGLDHWRKALPLLLVTELSQSKYVNVLSSDALYDVLDKMGQLNASSYSSRILKEIASLGRVNHILLGQLTKAGDQFRLAYRLERFGAGEMIGSGWVAGQGVAGFYPMIDALTRKVKEDLKLTQAEIAGDVDVELGKITTASPEAFLLYAEGRECHNRNDMAGSIELMKKALAIDPGFAMAYRSMAMSYTNSYFFAQADQCLLKALALGERISERERLLVEAEYYGRSENTVGRAIEAYRKFLDIYPDDSFANTKLAYIYLQYEMWDKAVERCRVPIQNKDRSYYPYDYLFRAYLALGQLDKAREIIEIGLRDYGENDTFHEDLADIYIYQGRFGEVLDEIQEAVALSPESPYNDMCLGNLYLYRGDLVRAAAEYQNLLKRKDAGVLVFYPYMASTLSILKGRFEEGRTLAVRAAEILEKSNEVESANIFRNMSAYCLWRSGRLNEALEEYGRIRAQAEKAHSPNGERIALHGTGLVLSAMNLPDRARRAADKLAALVEKAVNTKEARRVDHLLGTIELQHGQLDQAIDHLKKGVGRLAHEYEFPSDEQAFYFEPLAMAYYKSGDLEKARAEYLKITALTSGRQRYGDIYARSFYMLGKIAEQKGEKAAARGYYQKFLDLWKDADPGLPEVADAGKRLAALS